MIGRIRMMVAGLLFAASIASLQGKPHVVLIVCDDLNDYITGIPGQAGHPQASTPNVERLASAGIACRRAYSNNPVCAPSRSSFLTGIYGHVPGTMFWGKGFENSALRHCKTIMEHFRDNGCHVAGSGKLMHHHQRNVWSEFKHRADYGPFAYDGKERSAHPAVPAPFYDIGPVAGSYGSLADVPYAADGDAVSGWIYGARDLWNPCT